MRLCITDLKYNKVVLDGINVCIYIFGIQDVPHQKNLGPRGNEPQPLRLVKEREGASEPTARERRTGRARGERKRGR